MKLRSGHSIKTGIPLWDTELRNDIEGWLEETSKGLAAINNSENALRAGRDFLKEQTEKYFNLRELDKAILKHMCDDDCVKLWQAVYNFFPA